MASDSTRAGTQGLAPTLGAEPDFVKLFAEEAAGRLDRLGQDLLALEERGHDPDLIASVFREAHNIKGGAAVVGLSDVEAVAHTFEDILDELRSGTRTADGTLIDILLVALDGLRSIIAASVEGTDVSDRSRELVRSLVEAASRSTAVDPAVDPAIPVDPAVDEPNDEPGKGAAADEPVELPVRVRTEQVDSLRVPLTRLDELSRLAGEASTARLRVGQLLHDDLGQEPEAIDGFRDLGRAIGALQDEAMRSRMVPLSTIAGTLQRAVRDVARRSGKQVRWDLRGGDTEIDGRILDHLADPLLHLVRNAVDHGIELPEARVVAGKTPHASVSLHAMHLGADVVITVTDDGAGIDLDAVRATAARSNPAALNASDEEALNLIFESGLSTSAQATDFSGRGVGMDVVRTQLESVRGRVEVRSRPGEGTEFRISVPITLSVAPSLVVRVGGRGYALAMRSVVSLIGANEPREDVSGRPHVWVDGKIVPEYSLATTLGLGDIDDRPRPSVVLAGLTRLRAFSVDGFEGQREVVVKSLSRMIPRLDVVAGASVEPDGSILLVLDPAGLVDRERRGRRIAASADEPPDPSGDAVTQRHGSILVVDDALTVRELERSILERAGYEVRTANDGQEALARLAEAPADLVLTDLEMPNMDGFALVEAIRAHDTLSTLPVVILTTRADDASRRRGLEVGADGYVVKSDFDGASLIGVVERLLGARP
jgi:two-component system, chemotaxis family, sensor kinase CheA